MSRTYTTICNLIIVFTFGYQNVDRLFCTGILGLMTCHLNKRPSSCQVGGHSMLLKLICMIITSRYIKVNNPDIILVPRYDINEIIRISKYQIKFKLISCHQLVFGTHQDQQACLIRQSMCQIEYFELPIHKTSVIFYLLTVTLSNQNMMHLMGSHILWILCNTIVSCFDFISWVVDLGQQSALNACTCQLRVEPLFMS